MGAKIPKGPSKEEQEKDAELERQRVKYEEEKRRFIEGAAQNELISRQAMTSQEMGGFEFAPIQIPEPTGLMTPQAFRPSLGYSAGDDTTKPSITFGGPDNDRWTSTVPDWFWAPNLGISRPQATS
jgi:hypothetical protein